METMGPGYPEDLNSSVWSKELKDRKWVEIMKGERNWKPIGSFERGIDWFGDGSFWVLDAPGVGFLGSRAYLSLVR